MPFTRTAMTISRFDVTIETTSFMVCQQLFDKHTNLWFQWCMRKPDPYLALHRAIARSGNASRLATRLGISSQAVGRWRKVPPLRVLEVERITGVRRQDLRPDLYPREKR
jgi:hypothetical protein